MIVSGQKTRHAKWNAFILKLCITWTWCDCASLWWHQLCMGSVPGLKVLQRLQQMCKQTFKHLLRSRWYIQMYLLIFGQSHPQHYKCGWIYKNVNKNKGFLGTRVYLSILNYPLLPQMFEHFLLNNMLCYHYHNYNIS